MATGDAARQMAAAPTKDAAPKKENRYTKIFTGFTFSTPNTSTVYGKDDKDTNRITKKLANVLVHLADGSGAFRAGVKAVQIKGSSAKPFPEFTFFATQHQGSFVVTEESAKAEFEEWKANTAIPAFLAWRKQAGPGATVPTNVPALDDVEL
jgi:hypothetical protein